jgi:hypothetical protein
MVFSLLLKNNVYFFTIFIITLSFSRVLPPPPVLQPQLWCNLLHVACVALFRNLVFTSFSTKPGAGIIMTRWSSVTMWLGYYFEIFFRPPNRDFMQWFVWKSYPLWFKLIFIWFKVLWQGHTISRVDLFGYSQLSHKHFLLHPSFGTAQIWSWDHCIRALKGCANHYTIG